MKIIRAFFLLLFYLLVFYLTTIIIFTVFYLFKGIAWCRTVWARVLSRILNVQFNQLRGSAKRHNGNVMFLFNHTCHADFFVDDVISGGSANFISRLLVGIVFFPLLISYRSVWFFVKGSKPREKLYEWFDYKLAQSFRPDILVYPQGHRVLDLSLKENRQIRLGMVEYAFTRSMDVQVCIVLGRQRIISQKELHISWGQSVCYKFGNLIPSKGKELNDFKTQVTQQFQRMITQTMQQSTDRTLWVPRDLLSEDIRPFVKI